MFRSIDFNYVCVQFFPICISSCIKHGEVCYEFDEGESVLGFWLRGDVDVGYGSVRAEDF